jgi:glycosyltransferase involved in cell wall biosynthesis
MSPYVGPVPAISVCLLAYNHVRTLREAILSVLAQDWTDFELIVSDDCSTDDTWQLLEELARDDERLRPIRTPRNLGMAANANFAVSQARAPYIALLHHDDICKPSLLSSWREVAERHASVAFVSNAYELIIPAKRSTPSYVRIDYHPFQECTPGRTALLDVIMPPWGCPIRGTAFIRKTAWDAVGGMRESFGMLADIDLWMRLAARWDVGYVAKPLITVRHAPPADYPADYHSFSWSRLKLLYEIHGTNRSEYLANQPLKRLVELAKFRYRVSSNEIYWLTYAIVKRRWDILRSSERVANRYELPVARLARKALARSADALAVRTT